MIVTTSAFGGEYDMGLLNVTEHVKRFSVEKNNENFILR